MNSELEIKSEEIVGPVPVTVFHIRGDIDTNTYTKLQEKAMEVHNEGAHFLLLDLSKVDFISSAGLRALHSIYSMLRESSVEEVRGGISAGTYFSRHLKLLNPSPNVMTALKTAGFDMYLEVFEDRQQALDSFQ